MQELLRLKGFSEEGDAQGVLVQKQDLKFEQLLQAVKRGDVERFADQKITWMTFGHPIFEDKVTIEKTSYQVWLYRYSTRLSGSDKVYLYFDAKGKLKIYDYSPGGTMTPVIEVARDDK